MNKIMFTVVAAMAAFVTQAAAVNWTANNVYAGDGTTNMGSGYVGYLFLADQLTADDAKAAITGGKWDTISSKALAEQVANTKGKYTGALNDSVVADSYVGTDQSGYAIIFNAGSVDKATSFYVTDAKTMTVGNVGATMYALGTQAATQTATWSKVGGVTPPGPVTPDVPEPTSGLLLVLGGAALALRRKQK